MKPYSAIQSTPLRIGVVIPTYEREEVLTETLRAVAPQLAPGQPLVLVDQTARHADETAGFLYRAESEGWLRTITLPVPSIPHAMNVGLVESDADVVLFLDDDIDPDPELVKSHLLAHQTHPEAWAIVGQVLQPGEQPGSRNGWVSGSGLRADLDFPFWSDEAAWVSNVMAGNLSVKRDKALAIGGFDENFTGVAYRFETEFARRIISAGGRIGFEPSASLRHLRATRGGTRSTGSHLTSASPVHGMGDYYFALQSGLSPESLGYMLRRPFREVATRFHLRHPWYIPVKLLGELRAAGRAIHAWRRGPKYITKPAQHVDVTLLRESSSQ